MRLAGCVCAVFAGVALTAAASPPPQNVPPPHAPTVAPGEQSRILDLGPLIVQIPLGTLIGKITCDPNVLSPDVGLNSEMKINPAEYRPAFFAPAQDEGYRVTQSGASVFESSADQGTDAELVVGGTITSLYIENCVPRAPNQRTPGSITGALGMLGAMRTPHTSAQLSVTWEIFDPLERKVLLKVVTNGGVDVQRAPSFMTAVNAAFSMAARNLMQNPDFHRVATAPRAAVPPASEQAAASANAPTAIVRVPLSTTAFQAQSDKVLNQIATVMLGGSFGSGFYISDTLLLTNQHVVGLSQYVKVRLHSGKEVVGEVVSRDAGRDVALVKTESAGTAGLPLRTEEPGIGNQVFVIGTPLNKHLAQTVSAGIVSGFREINHHPFIQSEANTNHGNSGGPMIDDKGNVVGMSDLGLPEGINFFIPIGDALKSLNVLLAG